MCECSSSTTPAGPARGGQPGARAMPMAVLWVVLFGAGSPAATSFRDAGAELGIRPGNSKAAWADFDNDGWIDLCAGGELWRNEHGASFEKVVRLGDGVFADFDNDGLVDYFCYSAPAVFRNIDGRNFEKTDLPEIGPHVSRGAACGDFDNDGFADIYLGGYEDWGRGITYPDIILMNRRGRAWRRAWSEVRYRARGVSCCDFDRDGDIDIYVSNYRLQPNLLWRNDGTGRFADAADALGAAATWAGFAGGHSIGAAWADFDNDGLMDLFAGNFAHDDSRGHQPQSFFLRNSGAAGDFAFENKDQCGLAYQESYASPAVGDYDNDGDLDLFFTTVYGTASFGRKNYPVLYENRGSWSFEDRTGPAGLAGLAPTYQAAWADFDNDGDLDLVTAGRLFVNRLDSGNWLEVKLLGDGEAVNRGAIGTQVRLKLPGRTLTRQVEVGTGEGNQNDPRLHFGLGGHDGPVDIEVLWPGGSTQTLTEVRVNRLIEVTFAGPGP